MRDKTRTLLLADGLRQEESRSGIISQLVTQNQRENQLDGSSTLETDAKSDTGMVLDSGPRESVRNQACGTPAFSAVCGAGRSDAFQP